MEICQLLAGGGGGATILCLGAANWLAISVDVFCHVKVMYVTKSSTVLCCFRNLSFELGGDLCCPVGILHPLARVVFLCITHHFSVDWCRRDS